MSMSKNSLHSVLLDTSFFIRLLKEDDPLHNNAVGYYKYFLEQKYCLKISTIAISEFCVEAELTDLPLRNLQILPFNYNHGERSGKFAKAAFDKKKEKEIEINPRRVVPNDSKMFAQADLEPDIEFFVSADKKAKKIVDLLNECFNLRFKFLDISTPYNQVFGELAFPEE